MVEEDDSGKVFLMHKY